MVVDKVSDSGEDDMAIEGILMSLEEEWMHGGIMDRWVADAEMAGADVVGMGMKVAGMGTDVAGVGADAADMDVGYSEGTGKADTLLAVGVYLVGKGDEDESVTERDGVFFERN